MPPSRPRSVHPSPASPPAAMGLLHVLRKHEIIKVFSEFHIKRDASYLAPASVDIKDIYNRIEKPILRPTDLNLEEVILRYFRACPPHQNDSRIGYIVLTDAKLHHVEDNDRVQLTNVDAALQAGYLNLCQHIHLHHQLKVRSISRSHHFYFLEPTTRSTALGRGTTSQGTSTSWPS